VLTRQGWVVAAGAVALVAGGRVLGRPELFAIGLVVGLLLAAAALLVRTARLDLEVGRSIHPTAVHVGTPTRVELSLRNQRWGPTPVLRLRDAVTGTRGADLMVAPLSAGERAVAAYRLPTDRRGLVAVGPLEVVVEDPYGLARVATVASPQVTVTVLPRVDRVPPLPYTTGHDPQAGVRQPNSLGRTGEDFYALRPYVVGDDLRRVHWPSSARHDELLVRQNELPWQGRTTVLLDVRSSAHAGDSLEVAVSVAASVVAAAARRRDLVRLVTTAGADSGFGSGNDHVEAIMEHLAVVPTSSSASLRATADRLVRDSNGGALVAVVAEVPGEDLRALAGLRGRYGSVTPVVVDRSAWDPGAPVGAAPPLPVVHVTRTKPFPEAWGAHLRFVGVRRPVRVAP